MKRKFFKASLFVPLIAALIASCGKDDQVQSRPVPKDPSTATIASIDRFSSAAGHLQVRTATNGLPAANAPVNFDKAPFITTGLTPDGRLVQYYNFDVQPTAPAPIWAFFKRDGKAVPGQLNIIDVIPGDAGYNDFWQVHKVTVPDDYAANTITSYSELSKAGYAIQSTTTIVNCPVVPKGSTAAKRFTGGGDPGLTTGWYKGKVVFYFNFLEKTLTATASGTVPLSPIYVTFNINPDKPGGGPASGFKTEPGIEQTHNVLSTVPADAAYSPLWTVNVYDNASFNSVNNLRTAMAAPQLGTGVANVNCPVVYIK